MLRFGGWFVALLLISCSEDTNQSNTLVNHKLVVKTCSGEIKNISTTCVGMYSPYILTKDQAVPVIACRGHIANADIVNICEIISDSIVQ